MASLKKCLHCWLHSVNSPSQRPILPRDISTKVPPGGQPAARLRFPSPPETRSFLPLTRDGWKKKEEVEKVSLIFFSKSFFRLNFECDYLIYANVVFISPRMDEFTERIFAIFERVSSDNFGGGGRRGFSWRNWVSLVGSEYVIPVSNPPILLDVVKYLSFYSTPGISLLSIVQPFFF